jgi:hypothetical protein
MAREKTAVTAEDMFAGDELYQLRARKVLPLLVRQAFAQSPIKYGELANEAGMPNPRNLNYVLGSVGVTLTGLGRRWGTKIPPIQSLVVNQGSGLPGKGFFDGFTDLGSPIRQQRRAAAQQYLSEIFAYPKWLHVLDALGLESAEKGPAETAVEQARQMQGGGEGEAHRRLKERIYNQPTLVGAPSRPTAREMEYPLPSADRLDVYFEYDRQQFAVEVKASTSGTDDVARGLFQCVKYEAILQKWRAWESEEVDIHVVLALGGSIPPSLEGLRNALGVTVVDGLEA